MAITVKFTLPLTLPSEKLKTLILTLVPVPDRPLYEAFLVALDTGRICG
jgi:hypothetical protein